MNYETIQNFLNKPVKDVFKDESAIEQAQVILKRFECFNQLLNGKIELFNECEKICSLELLNNLQLYEKVDRNYIIGFKQGMKALLGKYNEYQQAKEYLVKKGN